MRETRGIGKESVESEKWQSNDLEKNRERIPIQNLDPRRDQRDRRGVAGWPPRRKWLLGRSADAWAVRFVAR